MLVWCLELGNAALGVLEIGHTVLALVSSDKSNADLGVFKKSEVVLLGLGADYGNSVLGATPSLHSPIVSARCG